MVVKLEVFAALSAGHVM